MQLLEADGLEDRKYEGGMTENRNCVQSSVMVDNTEHMNEHDRYANMLADWSDFLLKYQHDLQGPLRNIANYLQILKDELANADKIDKNITLKCISAAEHCVYTLNSINISQLLENCNKIESFNLEKLLEPLYCLLLSQLNERRCHIDIEPEIPNIIGNKDEILRVFKNLIENSLNHADTKKPLEIKIQKLCQRDSRIMLQINDNGKLLTERIRKKIIASFRAKSSGIAIVNSLITKNKGFLQFVKSNRGCVWELELQADTSKKQNAGTKIPGGVIKDSTIAEEQNELPTETKHVPNIDVKRFLRIMSKQKS